MKHFKNILLISVTTASILYALIAFTYWDLNAYYWDRDGRVFYAILLGGIILFFLAVIYLPVYNINGKDKLEKDKQC